MPLTQSSSAAALGENIAKEEAAGKDPKQAEAIAFSVQRANDEYVPVAVAVLPSSVTLATLNDQNREYWKNAGDPQ